MTWTTKDYQYMSRAIQLAWRGLYSTDPNPRVGCVLVKNDIVLAEGWHQQAGGDHAEIAALRSLSGDASGATCYLSLEPCDHHGRTPPCSEALIKAHISRLVVSMIDPNPLVAGKGLQRIKNAGITVENGLLAEQASALNLGFALRMQKQRPFVRCKLAMSMDGKTALNNGESRWISSAESRLDVQRLRARSSAVMTGAGTVIADDPSMNIRMLDEPCRQVLRVVLDLHLDISPEARILNLPGNVLLFTSSDNEQKKALFTERGIEVVTFTTENQQFLSSVLRYLAMEKQANEVLLEAGATLAGKMMQAGLLDELIFYIAPILLGPDGKGLLQLPLIENMSEHVQLAFKDIRQVGCDIRVTAGIVS